MRRRRPDGARHAIAALLALDAACSATQVVVAALAPRGSRAPLAAVAAVSTVGVASAAPALARAMRRGRRRDVLHALATVAAGLAVHTAGCAAVLPLAHGRQRAIVLAVLLGGDAVTLGYRSALRRLLA